MKIFFGPATMPVRMTIPAGGLAALAGFHGGLLEKCLTGDEAKSAPRAPHGA